MTKRITRPLALLAAVWLLVATALTAFASPPLLVDDADLLTAAEETTLQQQLDEIASRQKLDVVIVTVDDLDGKTAQDFADDYFDDNGYGQGSAHDGILLLVSMADRDWHVSTCGYGITAVTDYGLDDLSDRFLPSLSRGRYADAFRLFAERCDELVTLARAGTPFDRPTRANSDSDYDTDSDYEPLTVGERLRYLPLGRYALASLAIGFVIALIVVSVMKGKLKSVRPQNAAADYVRPGSMRLTESQDLFLYTHTTRTARPKDNDHSSGGGGGSSTHVSSSGTTHGGGGGKF